MPRAEAGADSHGIAGFLSDGHRRRGLAPRLPVGVQAPRGQGVLQRPCYSDSTVAGCVAGDGGPTDDLVWAVVNAAGAWVDELAERADVPPVGVQPKLRSAFISKPHADAASAGSALVADACERWYFKPEVGSVLASPADESDSPPCDARPDELAIARAIDAINEATTLRLRSVTRAWAGLRSFAPDRSPVVGARRNHDGFCFLAGQDGYGIQMAPALALVAADLVVDGTLSASVREYGVTAEELSPDRFTTGRYAASAGSRPLPDTR
jgi:glycine/D-amino acid oxidase-like deaminating enzyme